MIDPFALHPGVGETWGYVEENVLARGVVDQDVKELCLRVARGEDVDPGAYEGRERAAVEWAHAIVWDAGLATDGLWERLHSHFGEPELVDLGCAVGFELGRNHFLRTLPRSH